MLLLETDQRSEIDEVIDYIHANIYEPLPLSRLAGHAAYSPYHFTRIFKERIGVSPLYYVSAMRLQKAKDLLLRTNLSIREVGLEIGQQSLGTFTSRFTERVGVSPSQFRHSAAQADNSFHLLQKLKDWTDTPLLIGHHQPTITGTVKATMPFHGFVLIGLFARPMPEGLPLYGTLLGSLGDFSFANVRPGTYYLMATSVSWGMQAIDYMLPYSTLRTRSREPIVVHPYAPVPHQHVTLHVPRPDDPPILISLPLLMNRFLERVAGHGNQQSNR